MAPLRNCIFDLYGTLVDIHTDEDDPALWRALALEYRQHGALFRPKQLRAAYLRLVRQEEARLQALCLEPDSQPEIRLETVFRQLFAMRGISADDADAAQMGRMFRALSTKSLRLYEGVPELLQALRRAGLGVWLLSNAQRLFTAPELDALGLTDCFDGIYLSSDCGRKKPDPRFFRQLLTEQNLPVESAIMVGNDGTCDIAGAKAVGLRTLYIRSNLTPEEPTPQADHVLEEMDISQVQRILLSLSYDSSL